MQCAQLFGLDDDDDDAAEEPIDEEEDYRGYPDYGAYYDPNQIDEADDDAEEFELELTSKEPPPGYDYDIPALLQAISYEFEQETAQTDDYVPFGRQEGGSDDHRE